MYYINIEDGKINGSSELDNSKYSTDSAFQVQVEQTVYENYNNNPLRYVWNGEKIVDNPNYEEDVRAKERERIGNLQVTKRVFALGLQQLGITYAQLKELIATNEQAQMEWDLCVELQRSNPLLDLMGGKLEITPAQLDYIFRKANGEEVEYEHI